MSVTLGKAVIHKDSGKAVLVKIEDYPDKRWIPKSVIHDDSEIWKDAGSEGKLVVGDWFAEKEGYV